MRENLVQQCMRDLEVALIEYIEKYGPSEKAKTALSRLTLARSSFGSSDDQLKSPPLAAVGRDISMPQSQLSLPPFAARATFRTARTHILRTELAFAASEQMSAL